MYNHDHCQVQENTRREKAFSGCTSTKCKLDHLDFRLDRLSRLPLFLSLCLYFSFLPRWYLSFFTDLLFFLCLPSLLDELESESDSEDDGSESDEDEEYLLFLFFLASFRDFLLLPLTLSPGPSSVGFPDFLFFPGRK